MGQTLSTSARHRVPEIMDQPGLDAGDHEHALSGLRRVNFLSRSDAILWPAIAELARTRRPQDSALRVLDLATGAGDIPIALARRAERAGLNIQFDGCDVSPRAVDFARRQAEKPHANVRFFTWDALKGPLPDQYHVIMCSLFLHHLDEASAVEVLRRMSEAASRRILVNDLIRSRLGLLLAQAGCRLLTRSHVVHYDGPASVSAAFTPAEALALAEQAGLRGTTLTRHWPQRFLLSWTRE